METCLHSKQVHRVVASYKHMKRMRRGKWFLLLIISILIYVLVQLHYRRLKRVDFQVKWVDEDFVDDPELRGQQCRIPQLNPFHPDVLQYYSKSSMEKCKMTKHAEVRDGVLRMKRKDVQSAFIYYIRRNDDFNISYSEKIDLLAGSGKNKDVIAHPLKEDFVKLVLVFKNKLYEEYYSHISKPTDNGFKGKDDSNDRQLNIVMIMFDSISNANVQRNLRKTWKFLRDDPNTYIFKGQAIVGDGTTAQLCAMLTGIPEEELPEARRSQPNSETVDRWPFIFKDLHKSNYVTLYSEDDPKINTFHYRLKGFKDPPTTKYLRPFWQAMDKSLRNQSPACSHKINLDYLKRYLDVFRERKKFALIISSLLSHNSMDTIKYADQDIINFYEFLNHSDHAKNTVVILFGDHGLRTGKFRSSLQGKLEERLPFMSITLPQWFNLYRKEVENMRKNENILTSHFDIYATLQHLLTFPQLNTKRKRKFGKSLFSDIRKLNRTCSDAGVDLHWCPCLEFEDVDTSDKIVMDAVRSTIKHINYMNEKEVNGSCEILTLQKVNRAGRRKPNVNLQKFVNTRKNSNCDSCEANLDNSLKLYDYTYEISFSVFPSNGEYEVTTDCTFQGLYGYAFSRFIISRTNLYGSQPDCIAKEYPHLRKYCFCRKRNFDVIKEAAQPPLSPEDFHP